MESIKSFPFTSKTFKGSWFLERESPRDKELGNSCNPCIGVSLPHEAGIPHLGPPGLTRVYMVASAAAKNCNWKQVWRPASAKTNTQKAGADLKKSGLFSDASNLGDGGLTSQSPSPGKMGDSHLKTHLYNTVEAEVFIRRERGTEQRGQGRGLKSSLCADQHSTFQ